MSAPYILEPGIIQIFDNPNGRCEHLCEKAFNEFTEQGRITMLCMVRYWNSIDSETHKICPDCPFDSVRDPLNSWENREMFTTKTLRCTRPNCQSNKFCLCNEKRQIFCRECWWWAARSPAKVLEVLADADERQGIWGEK